MAGPRTKRQFAGAASDPAQRSITSFFKTTSSATSSADAPLKSSKPAPLNGPVLPPQIQTDLLTVGMRVRKAVPEGYKTGSAYSGFTLWSDETNRSKLDNSSDDDDTNQAWRPAPAAPMPAYNPAIRELEPFCGINKIGGLAFQPAYSSHPIPATGGGYGRAYHDDDLNDPDAMPGLTSSQDTVCSAFSFPSTPSNNNKTSSTTTRKRGFNPDNDNNDSSDFSDADSIALPYRGPVRSNRDSTAGTGVDEHARVLAVPRRSNNSRSPLHHKGSNGGFAPSSVGSSASGAENVMVGGRKVVLDGNDFEEASFLDYRSLVGDGRMDVE
ncbi:hypothetical protein VTJ04DRAFT_7501 [Mycothermus thermophilus]|uniref:uncharacterized protein n=1 Tax=Humicola insolens TaxID=85995 RepID=UPI003742B0D2